MELPDTVKCLDTAQCEYLDENVGFAGACVFSQKQGRSEHPVDLVLCGK